MCLYFVNRGRKLLFFLINRVSQYYAFYSWYNIADRKDYKPDNKYNGQKL